MQSREYSHCASSRSSCQFDHDKLATPSEDASRHVATDNARRSGPTSLDGAFQAPAEFIKNLAIQNQLLACLQWLNEFQILALIPQSGAVSFEEIADLADVPERQLTRVVRMAATAGFLHEPRRGTVAHTPLSAPFVTNLAFLDAAAFLGKTAAPGALAMSSATTAGCRKHGPNIGSPALAMALSSGPAGTETSKLQRQWDAYRSCICDHEGSVTNLLGRLNWSRLGDACVVDACAQSTKVARALARAQQELRFIVQMRQPSAEHTDGESGSGGGQIVVQERAPAGVQAVKNAAIYIVRLEAAASARIVPELRAHLDVLRSNPAAILILALPLLPEPGAVSLDAEARARLGDLCRLQLLSELELELEELLSLVQDVRDSRGRLVVASTLKCSQSAAVALGVKYRRFAEQAPAAET